MPREYKVGIYIRIHVEDVGRLEYESLISGSLELSAYVLYCDPMWQLGVIIMAGDLIGDHFDTRPRIH